MIITLFSMLLYSSYLVLAHTLFPNHEPKTSDKFEPYWPSWLTILLGSYITRVLYGWRALDWSALIRVVNLIEVVILLLVFIRRTVGFVLNLCSSGRICQKGINRSVNCNLQSTDSLFSMLNHRQVA